MCLSLSRSIGVWQESAGRAVSHQGVDRRWFGHVYSEPAETVISRSGDKCVCALTDQWYIAYGEPEWRAQVRPPPLSALLLFCSLASNAVLFV